MIFSFTMVFLEANTSVKTRRSGCVSVALALEGAV